MADEQSTTVDVDQPDVDTDVNLEDIEVTAEELEQAETTDESELSADIESDDDEDESTEEASTETAEESETEAADTEESDKAEEVNETPEQEQARFRAEMYEKRQQEKAERARSIQESQAAYLDEAENNQDLALRQLQIDAYETKVERVTNQLTNQYETALKDFPILRDTNPVVQRELDEAIDNFQSRFVNVDSFGNAVNNSGDMYAYLQAKAEAIQQLTGIGAQQQEKSKTKQKSKTLAAPGRSPREPKTDADLDEFWKEANS